jgi:threonylcarbamoyladenosine tRNA methylthiotransferase MtaB
VRHAIRRNPDVRIVVTGCYAQLQPGEVAEIPGVDLVLGAGDKFRILDHVEALGETPERAWVKAGEISDVREFDHAHSFGGRTRSFLKVQDGCDYKCAFCTIPKARGKSRSPEVSQVVSEAIKLQDQGVREVVLTGVNIGDFGANLNSQSSTFFDLIKALEDETSVPRYRISSIEPNLCHDQIIDFVSASDRFMPHFHMPLQSGSNNVLRRMRRRYRRELYAQRVDQIRRVLPRACVGADVIVGFPGERDVDFEETYTFLRDLDVSYLHVFTYSERPGTPAVEMDGVVPMHERRIRNERLRTLSDQKKRTFYHRHIGNCYNVLYEKSKASDLLEGFTENYIKVKTRHDPRLVNRIVPTTLTRKMLMLD